jgi:peptide/nickel transport system permease protein
VTSYIIRRILLIIPTVFGALSFLFVLFFVLPGDPATLLAGGSGRSVQPEVVERARARYGLDDSIPEQFVKYWGRTARWDLGTSYRDGRSVNEILGERTKNSVRLATWAIIIEIVVGLSVGVLSAIRRYSTADKVTTVATSGASAIPVFVLGLLLQVGVVIYPNQHPARSIRWGWIAIGIEVGIFVLLGVWRMIRGRRRPFGNGVGATLLAIAVVLQVLYIYYNDHHDQSVFHTSRLDVNHWTLFIIPTWETARYLILPAVVLASVSTALAARMMRGSMLEVIGADYMRTARAKGLAEGAIVTRHGMRNAMLPVVTLIGIDFGTTIGASVLTETIFQWPGLGSKIASAIVERDLSVILGLTLVVVLFYSVINLLVDLSYGWFDPRVRVSGGAR